MPGLYAAVHHEDAVAPDTLDEVTRRLSHGQTWFAHKLLNFSHGCHGIVAFPRENTGWASSPAGNQVLVYGEVFPCVGEEPLQRLTNDAELILALYETYGLEFVHHLNGSFCVSLYDAKAQQLILVTDRFASKPLYRDLRTRDFVVSSEIKTLLIHTDPPAYNPAAVVCLFALQHPLRNDTYFEGIEAVPPASLLIYDVREHSLQVRTYWRYNLRDEPPALAQVPLEELIERYEAAMLAALQQRMAPYDRIGTFISGGIDSRLMLGFAKKVADKLNKQVIAYTFGTENGIQNSSARRIAAALGVEHRMRVISDDILARYAWDVVWNGDGNIRIRDGHFVSCLPELREEVDVVMADYMSGMYFGGHMDPAIMKITDKRAMADHIFKRVYIGFIAEPARDIISKAFVPDLDRLVRETFDETVESIASDVMYKVAYHWDIDQRGRRYVLPITNYPGWYIPCLDPCIDNAVTDFAFELPVEYLLRKHFLRRVQHRLFPELDMISYEFAPSLGSSPLGKFIFRASWAMGRRAAFALQKYSRGKILIKNRDYRAYDYWIRTASKAFVQDVIMDKANFEGLFIEQPALQKILEIHLKAQKDHNQLICDALNFVMLHHYFVRSAESP